MQYAVDLIGKTLDMGVGVEGLSFHVGSQCTNTDNFIRSLHMCREVFDEARKRGYDVGESVHGQYKRLVDIGGGFPIRYSGTEQTFAKLSKIINKEIDALFSDNEFALLAEPGRFLVGSAGTAIASIILAKHSRQPMPCYHIDDGVYHTYSAVIYDHVTPQLKSIKSGEEREYVVFGPTCDGLDTISENQFVSNAPKVFLPRLENGDFIYAENMGAYTTASSSFFNGMAPAKVVHVNQSRD